MSNIKKIDLPNGEWVYVEVEEVDIPAPEPVDDPNLPEGAVPVSAADKMKDSMSLLKSTLSSATNMVYEGVKGCSPKEWSLELNVGFKGKASPIPVILSGESNVAIKVTAKWVND